MIKLKGLSQLEKNLRRLLKKDLVKVYDKTMAQSLLQVQRTAMVNTPHKTGNLKDSFRTKKTKATASGVSGKIWNQAEYAMFIHEETWTQLHHGGRHKFLEYALNMEKAFMKKAFRKNINAAFKGAKS